jgi:arylsulfatase A-like enzyme
MRSEQSVPWMSHLAARGYSFENQDDLFTPVSSKGGIHKITDPALYSVEDSDTAFLTDAYLADAAKRQENNWFSHLTYIRPHPPLVASAPYNALYDPKKLPLPARLVSQKLEAEIHPFFAPMFEETPAAKFVCGFADLEATDETVEALRAVYLGLASEVDHHIGRVLEDLKQSEAYKNTLVVITADHGEMLGGRHAWGKMSVYDLAYHTPLIIRAPMLQAQAGTSVNLSTETVDITPTILDWIGSDIPNSMDGRSLLLLIRGEKPEDWRRVTFPELNFGHPLTPTLWQEKLNISLDEPSLSILRDDQFTLVEFASDLPPLLFDHSQKGEFENMAEQESYAPILARLTREMLRFRMQNMDRTLALTAIT